MGFSLRTTHESLRPTARNSSPFPPLVVLAFDADAPIPCSCCCGAAAPLLPFQSSLRSYEFLLCRLSLSLSFGCSGFGVLYSRSKLSCQQGSETCPSSSFSTSRAHRGSSFARQTTQHQSLYRGHATIDEFLQLFCCGSCDAFFRHTDLEKKQLVKCTSVNARVNGPLTKYRVHQGPSSCRERKGRRKRWEKKRLGKNETKLCKKKMEMAKTRLGENGEEKQSW